MTSSSIFSSEDIANLIQVFDPVKWSCPDGKRPLILSGRSGNDVLSFETIVSRVEKYLNNTRANLVPQAELATELDITVSTLQLVLDEVDATVYYSHAGDVILPSLAKQLKDSVQNQLDAGLLDLADVAREQDIQLESLLRLTDSERGSWELVQAGGQHLYCSRIFADRVRGILVGQISIADKTSSKVDLSALDGSSSIPLSALKTILKHDDVKLNGSLQEQENHLIYFSPGFEQAEKGKAANELHTRVQDLLSQLQTVSFCRITEKSRSELDSVVDLLVSQSDQALALLPTVIKLSGKGTSKPQDPISTVVVRESVLQDYLRSLAADLKLKIQNLWKSGSRTIDISQLIHNHESATSHALDPVHQEIFSNRTHTLPIEGAAREEISLLEEKDFNTFSKLVEDKITFPIYLYATGLLSVADATLRERLDEHASKSIHRDISTLQIELANAKVLYGPQAREFSKFLETSNAKSDKSSAVSLAILESASQRLTKKLKLANPPDATKRRHAIKAAILQRTLQAMQPPSTRGSDVLQHALWILLATAKSVDGVFVSAGRDTSRMIGLYETIVGDQDISSQLRNLRDRLKAGETPHEPMQEVRELAMRGVEEFSGSLLLPSNPAIE